MKKIFNIVFSLIMIIIDFFLIFWAIFVPTHRELIIDVFGISLIFCILILLFINTGVIPLDEKRDFITKSGNNKESNNTNYVIEPILTKIVYPLQMIQSSARILTSPVSSEKQIAAAKFIQDNVDKIKTTIMEDFELAEDFNNGDKDCIPLPLVDIEIEQEVFENNSIGIYGENTDDLLKTNLILKSYGFFTRYFTDSQEVISAIEEGFIQELIILPESNSEDSFELCKKIREKNSLLEFPIIVIVKQYLTSLLERFYECRINDYLRFPFDASELILRLQTLSEAKKIYSENQQLLVSEKEKRTFLYFVTHNVNTPLTILLNEIQMLTTEPMNENFDKECNESLLNIQRSSGEINTIIQNVLNAYKISDGRFLMNSQVFNLYEFVEMHNMFNANKVNNKNQTLSLECSDKNENIQVFCDLNSLKGIYTNILDNAIKYAPINGKIKVVIETDDVYTYLRIKDNGKGIPKEKQQVLFNRFANIGSKPTGGEKSVGLGLFVVKEMCRLNNLELEYCDNTEEESGSVFTVKFAKLG